jgi:hypothetical protein
MRSLPAWILTTAALSGLVIHAPVPVLAQAVPPTVTVAECNNLSDTDVRDRIRDLAATGLKSELSNVNFKSLVEVQWAKAGVSARIDREVDDAIASIRGNSSWIDRAYSTVSQSAAARYATAVADKAYNSEGFKAALDEMATGVAKDAGAQIERATAKVSNPVLACVQTALQSRYGGAIAQVFAQESQKNLDKTGDGAQIKIETTDLAINNAASISGIVLIVTRRVIGRVVQSIGRRVAGLVVSRVVSSIAGLIGLALIAKDIYEAGEGVFPIISEKMKSDETKTIIKDEIGNTIQAEIGQQVNTIAQETADRIYTVWQDFKQKYNRLLTLAEKNPAFADFLKDRRLEQLGKLGQIVDIVFASEGEQRVFQRVADGSLNRAVLELSDPALVIGADQKSLDKALLWTDRAGRDINRVVELGLFRWLDPQSLSRETLQKILQINDPIAISRLANIDAQTRDYILSLPADRMRDFARRLTDKQLTAFADYQRRLEPNAARRLLRAATENPAVMQQLSGDSLRQAVIDSRDQLAALNMVLDEDSFPLAFGRIWRDAELAKDGLVAYRVFFERYWLSLGIALLAALIVLSWLRRLIFGRPTVVIRESSRR